MSITRMHESERYNMIVIHNGTVYLAGQVPDTLSGDIKVQTAECLAKIDALLKDAGSDRHHLLSAQIFIRDMNDFAAMNSVWNPWVADVPKPVRACVEARMASPDILVEICIIAAVAE